MLPYPFFIFIVGKKCLPCVAKIWLTNRGCSWQGLLILSTRKPTGRLQDVLLVTGDETACHELNVGPSNCTERLKVLLQLDSLVLFTKTKVMVLQTLPAWMPQGRSQRPWAKEVKAHFKLQHVGHRTKIRPKPCTAPWVKIFYVPPFAFLFWGAFLVFVFSGSLFKVLLFSGLVLGRVSAGPGLLCYCSSNMLFVLLTVLSTSLHWEQENQNEVKRWQTLTRAGTN